MTTLIAATPKQQFNQGGSPLAGGKLFAYASGTTTKLATYAYADGSTANANPVILNANGECNLFLQPGIAYDFVLAPGTDTDPPTHAYWTASNIIAPPSQFTQSGSGAITRTIPAKLADIISITDFDSIASANSISGAKFVPNAASGVLTTTLAATGLDGPYWGDGQIIDAAGHQRGKFFAAIKSAPASTGSGGLDTIFTGDFSKCQFAVEHRITGAATAGTPATGYLYTNEISPHFTYLYNESGHNEATSSNVGRTGIAAYRTTIYQNGQGDLAAFNASAFVTGTRSGSTSFLANPAGSLFNGDISAGADGVYLNPYEIGLDDNAHDAAGIGHVIKLKRNNNTGAKAAWWAGHRIQSTGSSNIDVAFSAVGGMNIGMDFSFATLPSSGTYTQAALTLKADQRIYGNASASDSTGLNRFPANLGGGEYFAYSSSLSAWNFVTNNNSSLQIYSNQVVVNTDCNVSAGHLYKIGGTNVVAARKTGWGTPSGTGDRSTFASYNAATISSSPTQAEVQAIANAVQNLSQHMLALIIDLRGHGLIGD